MEHLKDIVNGLLNSLPAEAAENEKIKRQDNCKKAGYGVCCNVHF